MEKKDIYRVLTYVGTFVAGGAVGAAIAEYITRKKMEALNEKDLNDLKKFYEDEKSRSLNDLKKFYEDEKIQSYFPNPAATNDGVVIPDHVNVITVSDDEDGEAAIFAPSTNTIETAIESDDGIDTHKIPYSQYFSAPDPTMTGEKKFFDEDAKPYHIDEDEFGTKDLYSEVTYMLYIDLDRTINSEEPVYILCDENELPVENVEMTVGDYSKYVTAYADPVYMRNDRLRIDYEILPTNIPYTAEDGVDRTMPSDEAYGE